MRSWATLAILVCVSGALHPASATAQNKQQPLSLPPRVTSIEPDRPVDLEAGGKAVALEARGLNLSGTSARVLHNQRPTNSVTAQVKASNRSATVTLQATAKAALGGGYSLVLTGRSGGTANVPVTIRVLAAPKTPLAPGVKLPPGTLDSKIQGAKPPIDSWTRKNGAASGTPIEFSSSTGFGGPGLPSVDLLKLYLGTVPLEILAREPNLIRAKIPYAPLPQIRTTIELSAAYRGVVNSTRVLDEAFVLDPALYDGTPRVKTLEAVRGSLDDLPWSTTVQLRLTVKDYPYPSINTQGIRRSFVNPRCFNIGPINGFQAQREANGEITFDLLVYFLESCSYSANRTILVVPTMGDNLFINTGESIRFQVRQPRRLTLQSTFLLRNILDPIVVTAFGVCSGVSQGLSVAASVGPQDIQGDLTWTIRSGIVGTACRILTHRVGLREGVRMADHQLAFETTTEGDSCGAGVGSRRGFRFDRRSPDALPPQPDASSQLPLYDQLPVSPGFSMSCKPPIEGGSFDNNHSVRTRLNSVTFLVDPELDVDESNIVNKLNKICFPSRPNCNFQQ